MIYMGNENCGRRLFEFVILKTGEILSNRI